MKTNLLFIIASITALVLAQDGLPPCAQPCVSKYLKEDLGSCSQFDIGCICSNKQFLGGIACCLQDSCSASDQDKAVKFALNLCQANKVTNLPTVNSGVCTATSSTSGDTTNPTATATLILTGTLHTTASSSITTGSGSTTSTSTGSSSSPTNINSSAQLQKVIWGKSNILSFAAAAIALLG
ncbi:hypothetical protein K3495_g14321 [Podosphaera aphanis]|nr:hypothetical protein K3495_g14321 [Podosphaera aphanis]